jgi:hypothetical protein
MEEITNKEKYTKEYNKIEKIKEDSEKEIIDLLIKNTEHTRSFWFNLLILSSAIIFAILPLLFEHPSYFKNIGLAVTGIIFLVVMNIISIFYFNHLLLSENNGLEKRRKFRLKKINEQLKLIDSHRLLNMDYEMWRDIIYASFINKAYKEDNNVNNKNKCFFTQFFSKHFSNIITWLVIIGICLIFLSFSIKII